MHQLSNQLLEWVRYMISYVNNNLFETPAHVLVNTVNTVGVMGKGIAKEFKNIYPDMFKEYQKLCEEKKITIGKLWLYKTSNKWILNFPTKTTWRKPSKIEYIEAGLKTFVRAYAKLGITSVAFPPLGCGNGELNWKLQVRPLMEKYLKPLLIDIFIYIILHPNVKPEHKNIELMKAWLRSEPETLSFIEVWDDLVEKISTGIILESLVSKTKFTVTIINYSNDKKIELVFENYSRSIYYEDLCEFWNQLRSYGFSMKSILPSSLEDVKEQIFTIFSLLSYCKPVKVSPNYDKLDNIENIGLQFFPQELPPTIFNNISHELIQI